MNDPPNIHDISIPVNGDFLGRLSGDVISPLPLDAVGASDSPECFRCKSSFRFNDVLSFLNFFRQDLARLKSPSPKSDCAGDDLSSLHVVISLLYSRSNRARFWKEKINSILYKKYWKNLKHIDPENQ